MARIVLIGDVGGCAHQLSRVIAPLLDDPRTVVVQVGDLIDRGPDSPGVLAFVHRRIEETPDRWVQLIGNHESQYVGGRSFWPESLPQDSSALLRTWWQTEQLRVAAAVRTADGEELLVTHAGLTVGAWRERGATVTAATTAELLNTRPDGLLHDELGPLWAEAEPHLYSSWLHSAEPAPYGQVHGHSTVVDFRRRSWMCGERIRQRCRVDWAARHTYTRIDRSRFIGIDPKHGRYGASRWAPLILDDATLLV